MSRTWQSRHATERCGVLNGNNGKRQISLRVPAGIADEMRMAAEREGFNDLATFAKELLIWAYLGYRQATALYLLKRSEIHVPSSGKAFKITPMGTRK